MPGSPGRRPDHLDASGAQCAPDELAGGVVAQPTDEARGRPRAPPPRPPRSPPGRPATALVVAARSSPGASGPSSANDHVEQQIAERGQPHEYDRRMDGTGRRERLRSFAIGGVIGAAGAIATVETDPGGRRAAQDGPRGLAAFEDAPCFLETVSEEARRLREAEGLPPLETE